MDYSFNKEIATEIGVDKAIMLHHLHYWILKNVANQSNYFDGNYWTYNSLKAFTELFPFWTEKQIRRILQQLEDDGYILTGNYNKSTYDRTKWYALTANAFDLYGESICPNGQMEVTKKANRFDQKGEPIPDNKPYSKPDINTDNKQKEKQEKEVIVVSPKNQKVYDCYSDNIHPISGLIETDKLDDCVKYYGADTVIKAIKAAVMQNKRTLSYIEGILRNWNTRGYPDEVKAKREYHVEF